MLNQKVNTLKLNGPGYPAVLRPIDDAPNQLYYLGSPLDKWLGLPKVAVVGSRKMTSYGKMVTDELVTELTRNGVVIISGLAYGVDAAAHNAAIDAGGLTVAVLPTSLDKIYPSGHYSLAQKIVESGGTLISEYPIGSVPIKVNFLARNRIVSGLSDCVLIPEAAINSGTMHTAAFALNQGKTVMAVPGNITNPTSAGCNNLIKSGAIPATSAEDVFFALKIKPKKETVRVFRGSEDEELVLKLIIEGIVAMEDLALASNLSSSSLSSVLTSLEISGHIRPQGNGRWTSV